MFTCIHLLFIFFSTGACLAGFFDGLQISQGIINGVVFGGDDNEAKLRLYKTSLDDYSEVPLKNVTNLCYNPYFMSNRTTKILIHGFNGKPDTGTAVRTIMKTYMSQKKYNVILLNWEKLAEDIFQVTELSYTFWGVPNAIKLGGDFADALLSMSKDCLDLNMTHILGHSLGAHVAGLAGNKLALKGKKLPWITGLDPTGNYFNYKSAESRINANSANFVDVIHTDSSNYGTNKPMGKVDFWPNYTPDKYVDQPGCDHNTTYKKFSDEDLCNHNRCWQFLLDNLYKYPGTIIGCHAKDYNSWKKLSKGQKNSTEILEMGKYDPKAKSGNYYLTTTDASQFGLGMDGI